ncbi:hypothetical protein C7S16_7087 [Burkholderia thailandensis]|uniref:Uncharacterized protein n=1 Tax=Burkholderia thailandensis TaxID=57975 RepID=A0AAW9CKK7_BURTH|nr:hypothetical protein [Burkholderia thailandensis]
MLLNGKEPIQGASHGIRRGRAPARAHRGVERDRRRDADHGGGVRAARRAWRRAIRSDAAAHAVRRISAGLRRLSRGRPNPYRIGSRLAGVWHEGHAEAASNDALDFTARARTCGGARTAANPVAFFRRRR